MSPLIILPIIFPVKGQTSTVGRTFNFIAQIVLDWIRFVKVFEIYTLLYLGLILCQTNSSSLNSVECCNV